MVYVRNILGFFIGSYVSRQIEDGVCKEYIRVLYRIIWKYRQKMVYVRKITGFFQDHM